MDLLPWIADERRRTADLVDGLSAQQLATPSLCHAWTVHEVAAHLLMPLVTPVRRVVFSLALSRFDFDRANRRLTALVARRSADQIAAELRTHAGHPFKPPGMSHAAPLTDLLVHQQDMRRPLGLPAALVAVRLSACLDFAHTVVAGRGARKAIASGLRFEATDLDWVRGNGPVVAGTGEALLMTLFGRTAALDELTGDGADLLRARLVTPGDSRRG